MRIQRTFYQIINTLGLGSFAGMFEGIPYFTSKVGELKNHAAIALPGIGIFVHPDEVRNIPLLRHEYGHILQAKMWGKFFFYKTIAWTSLDSAVRASQNATFVHQDTWTEWSANLLSYEYFKKPINWDFKTYPISTLVENREGTKLPVGLTLQKYIR